MTRKWGGKHNFLLKIFGDSEIMFIFAPEMPAHERVGTLKTTSMERDLRAVVRPVSKGRFRTLLSVRSNLANLNLDTAVMQQRASTWVDFISPCGYHSLYIYNKVYASNGHTLFAYIDILGVLRRSGFISSLAWAGLRVAYLYPEAMREPDLRDKHARDTLPRLFCFHILSEE